MAEAALIVDIAGWWLTAGAVVAVAFLGFGIDRIDPGSRGAYAFRPLLLPGILLIWPLVLWRWVRLERGGESWSCRYRPPRSAHLPAAIVLAAALALAMVIGLTARQTWPVDIGPEQLDGASR